MKTEKDLIGKEFLKIEDSEFGNIKITFKDGTIAYYNCYNYPDGSVSEITFERIKEIKEPSNKSKGLKKAVRMA